LKEFFSGDDNNSDPICIKGGEEEGPIWAIGWWCCSAPSVSSDHVYQFAKMETFLGLLLKKEKGRKATDRKSLMPTSAVIEICETSRKCKEHLGEIFLGHLEGTLYILLVPPQK
jgi:hypothetical protein